MRLDQGRQVFLHGIHDVHGVAATLEYRGDEGADAAAEVAAAGRRASTLALLRSVAVA